MPVSTALLESDQPWDWLARAPDEQIPLFSATLLIARDEYPQLPVAHHLEQVQQLGEALQAQLPDGDDPLVKLRTLNHFLYDTAGFSGNFLDYYDPRNSYLNEVLDRRLGIPITLAVLYLELGRRIGVDLEGVSFPGHFLVRMDIDGGLIVLDPYHRGKSVGSDELKLRARAMLGVDEPDDQALFELLNPAPNRAVLTRMLHNLKALYNERNEPLKALRCADRIVLLDPQPGDIRDRGLLYHSVGAHAAAMRDLERYLAEHRDASDFEQVESTLRELKLRPARLH
jgi:regulator of sirC expression with transglutaminase-like and TPR domain